MWTLVLSLVLVPALAAQLPFNLERHQQWNVLQPPNPNATDHLVFETVYSLLQQWPNTRMRNGHNIVPGTIPKGTLLYHGTRKHQLPPGPEWVGTDPEHSYFFCRGRPDEGCWHLTLVTTRPLKIVYFDGSSAAKLPFGSMDTQDLIAWGRLRDPTPSSGNEFRRIQVLCEWGKKFAVDGFVRMEADFEVMLCDFTSGVSVVSFSNLVSREALQPMMMGYISFETMHAGTWHNRFPGETRIHLDLAGLVSFYDIQLAPSLVDIRVGQERWDHRVQNISSADLLAVKSKLEAILARPKNPSSGIDWRTLTQVIVDRYAGRLELTRHLLNSSASEPDEIINLANKTQSQLRIMLAPYLLLSTRPSDKGNLDWTIPTYKLCATAHTRIMDSELGSMTGSEKLLLRAIRGTTREICRVVTKMWATGVYAGIDRSLNTKGSLDIAELSHLLNVWTKELGLLMGWLDWNVWVKCSPGCAPDEMCYLPTWPDGFPPPYRPRLPESLADSDLHTTFTKSPDEKRILPESESTAWIRPQPMCIRKVYPYDRYL